MSEIGVLTTHLARTDRRALSTAWYQAWFGRRAAPSCAPPAVTRGFEPTLATSPLPRTGRAAPVAASRPPAGKAPGEASPRVAVPERRAAADIVVQRIGRAVVRLARTQRPVACTVALGTGRVQLLVRSDAGGTRIVAVCAAADRERVGRALAAARFAVAGAGIMLAA